MLVDKRAKLERNARGWLQKSKNSPRVCETFASRHHTPPPLLSSQNKEAKNKGQEKPPYPSFFF
jgi:hypothetical protein